MAIEFKPLPFAMNALEPHMSQRTLEFHYGKHHRKYVTTLNQLIENTPFANMELEEIVIESAHSHAEIFNNAGQTWNHNFFWKCLRPVSESDREPGSECKKLLAQNFGTVGDFKAAFNKAAAKLFGSGWTWLVKNSDGTLAIQNLGNAGNPLVTDQVPLLVCDVWEHAYYLDYQNERPKFLENFWSLVNWEFVEANLRSADQMAHYFLGKGQGLGNERRTTH